MAAARFYVPQPLRLGTTGELADDQSRQARTVLRLAPNSRITLFDGSGNEAVARIIAPKQSVTTWEVESVTQPEREPPLRVTAGLALLKGERFEIALQKLTELGVERIVPLNAERCVVSFDVDRAWEKRLERFRRIIQEAAEQSERLTLPPVDPPMSLRDFLDSQPVVALVERGRFESIAAVPICSRMAIAVGPEGGWSGRELRTIEQAAAGTASLGTLILRAETAAIVAAGTLIQRAWSELPAGRQQEQEQGAS